MAKCTANGVTIECDCGCGIICTTDGTECWSFCELCPEPQRPGSGQSLPAQRPVIARIGKRDSGRRPPLDVDMAVEIQVNGVSVAGLAQVLDALVKDEVSLPLRRSEKRLRATRRKTTVRDFARSVGLGLESAGK
jgi:hypothetical protein